MVEDGFVMVVNLKIKISIMSLIVNAYSLVHAMKEPRRLFVQIVMRGHGSETICTMWEL